MSFWQHASTQQRLAQIDGSIEVGMTMRQTAMNLGTTVHRIDYFSSKHGRHFNRHRLTESASEIGRKVMTRKKGTPEVFHSSAFEIFPSRANEDHILDKRGDE